MKILFFGLGSIGTRQVRLIKQLYQHELFAFRSGIQKEKNPLGLKEIYSWRTVDRLKPDVAFITNPTSLHIDTAIACAKRNIDLFIEKPLGSNLKHLDALLKIVKQKKVSSYIAYVLRFHPVVDYLRKEMKKNTFLHMRIITTSFLPAWGKTKDVKRYSAYQHLGGGVINDLSHEIDLTEFILGPIQRIQGQFARRSQVTVDTEDYADLFIETKTGPANIHINFLSQKKQRVIQIDFKEKLVVGDFLNGTVTEFKNDRLIKKIKFEKGYEPSFKRQLQYFFKNIHNPRMMNNVFVAAPLIKKIQEFKKK